MMRQPTLRSEVTKKKRLGKDHLNNASTLTSDMIFGWWIGTLIMTLAYCNEYYMWDSTMAVCITQWTRLIRMLYLSRWFQRFWKSPIISGPFSDGQTTIRIHMVLLSTIQSQLLKHQMKCALAVWISSTWSQTYSRQNHWVMYRSFSCTPIFNSQSFLLYITYIYIYRSLNSWMLFQGQ